MATRTVVCPDCNEPLTLGRLSCSNCGSLLASVAGAPRRSMPLRTVSVDEPPWLSDDNDLQWMAEDASRREAVEQPGRRPARRAARRGRTAAVPAPSPEAVAEPELPPTDARNGTDPIDDALLPEPETLASSEPVEAAPEPEVESETATEPQAPEPDAPAAAAEEPVPDPESSADVEPAATETEDDQTTDTAWVDVRLAAVSAAQPVEQSTEEFVTPSPVVDEPPDAVPDETAGAPGDVDDAAEPPPPEVTPARQLGRWPLPAEPEEPGRVMRPSHSTQKRLDLGARGVAEPDAGPDWARADDAQPSLGTLPAGAWLPPALDLPEPAARAAAAATEPAAVTRTGEGALRASRPFDAPSDLPAWLAAVGSGFATLGFLLPWAAVAPGATGWTQRWGLADPSHGFVLLAAAILLGLNVVPNRLPAWIPAGALPIGLGGLLVGLVWPAMLSGAGMQLGAVVVTIAAVTLLFGGMIGVHRTRHEGPTPRV